MKNFYLLLSTLFILASCTNVKKLIEQGRYDDAMEYSIKKLAGKDKKKTEHVIALEDAYARLVEKDVTTINYLEAQGRPEMYTKIHNLYEDLHHRQNKIKPLLPLVSEDGYEAYFDIKDYGSELRNSSEVAAKFHYNQAIELIKKAKSGDKMAARAAYRELSSVENFFQKYEDKDSLKDVANYLGMTRILVEAYNDSRLSLPRDMVNELTFVDLTGLYSRWVAFYYQQPNGIPMDIKAELSYTFADVSPERVVIDHHTDTKEIVVGTRVVQQAISVKDSTGKYIVVMEDVTEDIVETITATTTETYKDKSAHLEAKVLFLDLISGHEIKNTNMEGNTVFSNKSASFSGNKNALCDSEVHSWSSSVANFPSDEQMLLDASVVIKKDFYNMLKNTFE